MTDGGAADAQRLGERADEVLTGVSDGIGRLTLNRPAALNALSHGMITTLAEALDAWRTDPEVAMVAIDGAGTRGLCAGGDVRRLRENALAGRPEASLAFWRDEYALCAAIARYPKPYIALMDGITMGGGVGVSAHGAIRIVTERSRVAMPETRIGFGPDVGGTWLLARAPGFLGRYLGLNGAAMDAADAIACGFADYLVPSDRLGHLLQALGERADPGTPTEVVLLFDETPGSSALIAKRRWIDACYSAESVGEIIRRLRSVEGDAAVEAGTAADELESLSPTALTVALAAIIAAEGSASLDEVLEREFRMSGWLAAQPDLAEGIRAQLVDKDFAPRWQPASLAEVDGRAVAAALAERA